MDSPGVRHSPVYPMIMDLVVLLNGVSLLEKT